MTRSQSTVLIVIFSLAILLSGMLLSHYIFSTPLARSMSQVPLGDSGVSGTLSVPTPVPSPIANPTAATPQTFTDSDFNLSLQYPAGYMVLAVDTGTGQTSPVPYTLLSLEKTTTDSAIHRTFSVVFNPLLSTPTACISSKPHTKPINGQLFYYSDPQQGSTTYSVFADHRCYTIQASTTSLTQTDRDQALQEFDQILSSFKFAPVYN